MPAPLSEPKLPSATKACPKLQTGKVEILGVDVGLWVGEKRDDRKGPVLFYWHGTGSSPAEVTGFAASSSNQEILEAGGLIAALYETTGEGETTGPAVWYTGDFAVADEILACAIEQLNIDTKRIYTAGCSAGGLQASTMVYERSGYLAAAIPNSGGIVTPQMLRERGHVPAVMAAYGSAGSDVVIVSFAETSKRFTSDIAALGGFAVNCDHGGGHCGSPLELRNAQWQFLKDHPFGVSPEPYANGLPAGVPSYCKIVE